MNKIEGEESWYEDHREKGKQCSYHSLPPCDIHYLIATPSKAIPLLLSISGILHHSFLMHHSSHHSTPTIRPSPLYTSR